MVMAALGVLLTLAVFSCWLWASSVTTQSNGLSPALVMMPKTRQGCQATSLARRIQSVTAQHFSGPAKAYGSLKNPVMRAAHKGMTESKKAFFAEVNSYRMTLALYEDVSVKLEPCVNEEGTVEFKGHGVATLVVFDSSFHKRLLPISVQASLFFPHSSTGPSWAQDVAAGEVQDCALVQDNVDGPSKEAIEAEWEDIRPFRLHQETWAEEGPPLDGVLTSQADARLHSEFELGDSITCEFHRGVTKGGHMFYKWNPKGVQVKTPSGEMRGLSGFVTLNIH
ncbi:unnamed protein product [Polarella glacialis]|uniref:Altered inheritance of mitochondria protein 24, mitochondrial n=1 Tax=Polarella glacialis TaxID=89957 RepID=A0A813H2G2_POLGL|nr:unnamed protein product [Polarella glacialis]CAE8644988.1 unnamed protein product [Polarella glacialis]|mmetsp:Transcript_10458/g.16726  ORF Transcript_10458/g.16726 Transcript_10458/m.16726 type:complete len:281 (-) Transcript_10458:367-1209(-)